MMRLNGRTEYAGGYRLKLSILQDRFKPDGIRHDGCIHGMWSTGAHVIAARL